MIKAGGADKLLHFGSKMTLEVEIDISFRDGLNRYSITLQRTDADQLYPRSETVYSWDKRTKKAAEWALAPLGTEAGLSSAKYKKIGRSDHTTPSSTGPQEYFLARPLGAVLLKVWLFPSADHCLRVKSPLE